VTGYDYLLSGVNAAVATLLLMAGAAKVINPSVTAAALGELRRGDQPVSEQLVRVFGATEMLVAVVLSISGLRVPAASLTGLLGVSFAAAGLLGMVRGTEQPCGCFGAESNRPLGPGNLMLGLAFAGVAVADLLSQQPGDEGRATLMTAALVSILTSAWLIGRNARQAARILKSLAKRSEAVTS
jgi:hypothetical protein